MEILLCLSQQPNDTPYQFKVTGIHVYTFEEVLYHVYHYWKQSVDDYLSDGLIAWVNDTLGLSFLAARMKELTRIERFSQRLPAFLRLTDYCSSAELESLNAELEDWEKRLEWEKFKERADYLMTRSEPDQAFILYKRALQYAENTALLNNAGVALMKMERYEEAFKYLQRALALEESDVLLLHTAEAAVLCQQYGAALTLIDHADKRNPSSRDVLYLRGALADGQGDYQQSIAYFRQAIGNEASPLPYYVYRLSDIYVKLRQYEKALSVLERIAEKDVDFYLKQAELHATAGNVPAAVKSVQKAIVQQETRVDVWINLAMYHRMDYDLTQANEAIDRALALDPENSRAKLENARIKKAMGRTKDYQSVLNNVLGSFRQKYRELEGS